MVSAQSVADPAVKGTNVVALSEKNFRHLCEFVHSVCGIRLTTKKKSMVDGRIRRRMRALGITNINDYCQFLFAEKSVEAEAELVHFIDAVTTNKTDFFREPAHFAFLQDRIFPSYLKTKRRDLKVWSAASSTGAEAYTIAMVIDSFFHGQGDINYDILATDICTDVLEKGRAALYPATMLDPIPEELRRRYVLIPKDPSRREFLVNRKLRARINFQQLNLMDDRYPCDRDFDLIFLRNVLIYFDRPTQESVLSKLCEHLKPGGYLFLGHSESLAGSKFPLDLVANTIFRRR